MKTLIVLAVVAAGAALALAATQTAFAMRAAPDLLKSITPSSTLANYDGRTIDLSESWEGALACAITAAGNFCFDSATERDWFLGLGPPVDLGRIVSDPGLLAPADIGVLAETDRDREVSYVGFEGDGIGQEIVWAGAVRLYELPSFTGMSIAFAMRGTVIDLAAYSFADTTASYAVEACTSTFLDEDSEVYPCVTSAGSARAAMAPGWHKRVRMLQIG